MKQKLKLSLLTFAVIICCFCTAHLVANHQNNNTTSLDDVCIESPSETTYPYRQENIFINSTPSLSLDSHQEEVTSKDNDNVGTNEIVETTKTPVDNIDTPVVTDEEEFETPGISILWKVKSGNFLQVPCHSQLMKLPSETAQYTIISSYWQRRCLLASIEINGKIDIYLADINGTLTHLNEGQTIVSYIVDFKELYWFNSDDEQWIVEWTNEIVSPRFYFYNAK